MNSESIVWRNYHEVLASFLSALTEDELVGFLSLSTSKDGVPINCLRISKTCASRMMREILITEIEWLDRFRFLPDAEVFDAICARHGSGAVIPIACTQVVVNSGMKLEDVVHSHLSTLWSELSATECAEAWRANLRVSRPEERRSWWERLRSAFSRKKHRL